MSCSRSTILALALAAALPTLAPAYDDLDTSRLVPAQLNVAGFFNVEKIQAEYGYLFDGGPLAERIDQFVAMGMPDPRLEDIAQVALATQLEGIDEVPAFAAYVTRHHGDSETHLSRRFADWVDSVDLGRIEESAYRGVILYGLREQDERMRAKLADYCGRRHLVSIDPEEQHPFVQPSVDTLRGENPSFFDVFGAQLDGDTYVSGAAEMPEDMDGILGMLEKIKLRLRKQGENIRLVLEGASQSEEVAAMFKAQMEELFFRLKQNYGDDPTWGPIIGSVVFELEGKVNTVSVELPEEMVREFLEDLTGHEA